jgi:hypothetical protein
MTNLWFLENYLNFRLYIKMLLEVIEIVTNKENINNESTHTRTVYSVHCLESVSRLATVRCLYPGLWDMIDIAVSWESARSR